VDLGYARVSTGKQDLERQIHALTEAGIAEDRIYLDKRSGATTDRPEGLSPPRRPHPRALPALLAGAAADPHHRARDPRHLAQHPQRDPAPALGTFTGPAGTCQQRTELTTRQRDILRTLKLPEPARFTRLDPAPAPVPAT